MIMALARAGMDVARLNFSHGTRDDHRTSVQLLRDVEKEIGRPLGILQDLGGPKIRTGRLRGGRPVMLRTGAALVLTSEDVAGAAARGPASYPPLARGIPRRPSIFLSPFLIPFHARFSPTPLPP